MDRHQPVPHRIYVLAAAPGECAAMATLVVDASLSSAARKLRIAVDAACRHLEIEMTSRRRQAHDQIGYCETSFRGDYLDEPSHILVRWPGNETHYAQVAFGRLMRQIDESISQFEKLASGAQEVAR
jgi:hypothetical protein